MSNHKTKKAKEIYLNQLLADIYSLEQAKDNYIYLCSKNRSPRTTESHLKHCIVNHTLGSLIRRLDPIQFNSI